MGLVCKDDGWRQPDEFGLPSASGADRVALNAILLVLRTGMQWNALNGSGICSSSSAYRRFAEWRDAGVFENFCCDG